MLSTNGHRSVKDQGHTTDTWRCGALTLSLDKGTLKLAVRKEESSVLKS